MTRPTPTPPIDRSSSATGKGLQSSVWPGEIAGIVDNAETSQVIGKAEYIPDPGRPDRARASA